MVSVFVVTCEQDFATPAFFDVIGVFANPEAAAEKAKESDSYRVNEMQLQGITDDFIRLLKR